MTRIQGKSGIKSPFWVRVFFSPNSTKMSTGRRFEKENMAYPEHHFYYVYFYEM